MSTIPGLDEMPIDDSPLNRKYSVMFVENANDDYDTVMENTDTSSSASSLFPTEQGPFQRRNSGSILSNPKFSLNPTRKASSSFLIAGISPVTSTSSVTSIESYFAHPPTIPGNDSLDNVIPTKPSRTSLIESLPPNRSALINSKPALSWTDDQDTMNKQHVPVRNGPSKVSFTITPTQNVSPLARPENIASRLLHSPFNTFMNKPNSSWAVPALRNDKKREVNSPTLKPFSPTTTPRFPRHGNIRRTHSMFQHPEDILADEIKESKAVDEAAASSSPATPISECNSILNMKDCPIKTFNVKEDQFKRVDPETLCNIMDGVYSNLYERYLIIDCRFEYEYEGGHIEGAINVNSTDRLEEILLSNVPINERVLLIFHCEYSAHRGPRMAMHLRNMDRQCNISRYPYLHYPDIAILSGGYSHFFSQHNIRCYPQMYVGMNDNSHKVACEREMGRFRRSMKASRTQSEFFGSSMHTTLFPENSYNSGDTHDSKDYTPSRCAVDDSPLVNASKSYSCFEFSNTLSKGRRNNTRSDDLQKTPTACNTQFRRKLGVKY